MYFGTRCASFAGSFEQPTTAIVLMPARMSRIAVSSTVANARICRRTSQLRFRRQDLVDRGLDRWCDIERVDLLRREPTNFGMLFVRDARLTGPPGDEEQVVTKQILRRRVDVLVYPKEPRTGDFDPELFLQFPRQRRGGLFAGNEVATERIPHPGEPNRTRSFSQEDAAASSDQARRGDVDHA